MENRDDRHWWNSITLQIQRETVDRMGHQCTHDHQGQSMTAHQQAGYRRAVQSMLPVTSTILAPPGESI
jgi:GTP-dependent phosphoenolpyruvate carboxykinase